MRFQAAFGRGTRGQRVHILPVGVFRATWERQSENLGFLVFRLPFCLSQRCFSWDGAYAYAVSGCLRVRDAWAASAQPTCRGCSARHRKGSLKTLFLGFQAALFCGGMGYRPFAFLSSSFTNTRT